MDSAIEKKRFLNNVLKRLDELDQSKDWLNKQIFGESEKGVAKSTLWRTGQQSISFEKALRAADILGKSIDELMGDETAKAKAPYLPATDDTGAPGPDSRPPLYTRPGFNKFQGTATADRPDSAYLKDVEEIMASKESGIIAALRANIVQFREMVRDRQEMQKDKNRIKKLENDVEQLSRQLNIEKNAGNSSPNAGSTAENE